MTVKEAYQVLGLPQETGLYEIKKKYRKLMMQVHPDVNTSGKTKYPYNAQEINIAYSTLEKKLFSGIRINRNQNNHPEKKQSTAWNAPINPNAYMEREVLQYVEDYDGTVLGSFCIAKGKYMWTTDEDFSLFLLSLYQCSKLLLDEIDDLHNRQKPPAKRPHFQAELTYLLAQQFISQTELLKEIAIQEKSDPEGNCIFYIPSMLEISNKTISLRPGETLYPSKIRQHKLYLKNQNKQEAGYLSFSDDRLYYIVIPLFEQKVVQVKIQVAEELPRKKKKKFAGYQNLHVWIKLSDRACKKFPESLNLQIEQLLNQYK